MPDTFVEKTNATTAGVNFDALDGRRDACIEADRQMEASNERERTGQERLEKARLRGKHALEKEVLNGNYSDILGELSVLERADREKRQRELGNIPKEIFLPAWQRDQHAKEVQYELEREFEKIYADSSKHFVCFIFFISPQN